ncbi:MAG TPA: acyl-ACP thioesterase domain-containing protein [Acidimicrobiales bacterium]|nr:acyl-ACP thioesterase domain-containing protein [Acidimicrobiales bacterium]
MSRAVDGGPPPAEFVPVPSQGRVYTADYRVRLGDVAPTGRARLDALARYLQDAAEDDAADAQWPASIGWVVRWTKINVRQYPVLGEQFRAETFCSATGPRWAERTTVISGSEGACVLACAAWVAVSTLSGRTVDVGELFERVYAPSAGRRRASVRLHLEAPTPEVVARARPWPLRGSDFDAQGHLNNVVSWVAVEDELSSTGWLPSRAEVEYNEAIFAAMSPRLVARSTDVSMDVWLLDGERPLTSAHIERSLGDRDRGLVPPLPRSTNDPSC